MTEIHSMKSPFTAIAAAAHGVAEMRENRGILRK